MEKDANSIYRCHRFHHSSLKVMKTRVPLPLTEGQHAADELSTRPKKHNHWCCVRVQFTKCTSVRQYEIILTKTSVQTSVHL